MRVARHLRRAGSDEQRLDCRAFVALATAYLDGALAPPERVRADRHLARCADCARYLRQLRMTVGELGRIDAEDAGPPPEDRAG